MGARAGRSLLTAGGSVPLLRRKVSAHKLGGYLAFRASLCLMGKRPFGRHKKSSSVTSAKAEVNGVHLHYLRTGDGEHAVLLLPGMLGSGETDFGPQIEKLNKKLFTVVAWDPRGYGHSRPPDRDFPVDFFERDAKDAVDLMKTLKFKKVSLLGWSDGGITALIAAARYPSYVSKMVIWGANAYVTEQDTEIYQGIRDVSKWSERTRKPLEALYGFDYFARTCEKWVDGIEQFKHLPDGSICLDLLPLVQCPTLIVHGEKDPLVPRFHADFLHRHVRGSRLKHVHLREEPVLRTTGEQGLPAAPGTLEGLTKCVSGVWPPVSLISVWSRSLSFKYSA